MELSEEDVYCFPKGLPGFDEEDAFVIVPWEDTPFSYLQSVKEPALAFLLVSPFLFVPDYSFELSEADKEELEIQDQVSVYSIVTIQAEASKSTMNLLAPIVLNPEKEWVNRLFSINRITKHVILFGQRMKRDQ